MHISLRLPVHFGIHRLSAKPMAPRDIFGHPATERRLLVCTGPCCNPDGAAEARLEALRKLIVASGHAETLIDRASCVRRSCLGKCSGDPLAMVHPDECWYSASSSEALLEILEEHVLSGTPLPDRMLPQDE
jgi:(2Fe-2S) ferredoxin